MCLQVDEELLSLCADLDRWARRNPNGATNPDRPDPFAPRLRERLARIGDPRFANDPDPNWRPI